eukprot:6241657-Amphidinium_carterae.1
MVSSQRLDGQMPVARYPIPRGLPRDSCYRFARDLSEEHLARSAETASQVAEQVYRGHCAADGVQ